MVAAAPPKMPEFIVAEVSRNFVNGVPADGSEVQTRELFENAINTNLARGYLLDSWKVDRTGYMASDGEVPK